MILLDNLRPPSLLDPSIAQYKDWLHLNILHHESGSIGVINVSLHGAPNDPRSRAVGTALVYLPNIGWFGNVEVRGFDEIGIGRASIGLEHVALAAHRESATVLASVVDRDNALNVQLIAKAVAPPVIVEDPLPLGNGWISWFAVPRLTVDGEWTVGDARMDLRTASAYHDHNWGRWHWGDDLGWEWGCFLTPAPGAAVILSRTTDRAHRHFGKPSLVVQAEGRSRTFAGGAVKLSYSGTLGTIARRVPGALASLHQDYAEVRLPRTLEVTADDGVDRVTLEFTGRSAAQLILGDPVIGGYAFIHEIAGEFKCSGMISDVRVDGAGLGVMEHVY
jgi:hypothetical protein